MAPRARLGRAYAITGRSSEAVEILADSRAAAEQALGQDDAVTLAARNDLAWATLKMGKVSQALARHVEVVASLERVLGADSAATAAARSDLISLSSGRGSGTRQFGAWNGPLGT
jgi:hypothetical protein